MNITLKEFQILLGLYFFASIITGCSKGYSDLDEIKQPQWKSNRTLVLQNGDSLNVYDPYYKAGHLRLKGQMHCHTKNSDGTLTPEQLANLYYENGYDFWTITDHNHITLEPKNNRIIWLCNSYEHTVGQFHACIYNVEQMFPLDNSSINVLYTEVKTGNTTSYFNYAHPDWPKLYHSDEYISSVKEVDFVEIINGAYQTTRPFDILLSQKKKIWGLGVEDFHSKAQLNRAFIQVLSSDNSTNAILSALNYGSFFATNGLNISVRMDRDGVIHVEAEQNVNIRFIGYEGHMEKQELSVKESTYKITGKEHYIRCEAETTEGMRCYSQPIVIL